MIAGNEKSSKQQIPYNADLIFNFLLLDGANDYKMKIGKKNEQHEI
jgi:hypothetical protein